METKKRRLLVLSAVLPFPRNSGQQQRVFYTLQEARKSFHVTFVTFTKNGNGERIEKELLSVCDEVILLPSIYTSSKARRLWHKIIGTLHTLQRGVKFSNYVIGHLEFSPSRVSSILASGDFDCALFEYWHAAGSISTFHDRGIPCVLDMHNILWQDYKADLNARKVPKSWKQWAVSRYKSQEELAWRGFDGLIAINREEMRYVQQRIPAMTRLFYAPMGTDLTAWPFSWSPSHPQRLAYYGGLASPRNQQAALKCYEQIMPEIWRVIPDAELWLVGSNPPGFIRALSEDNRVRVTGYVNDVQHVLRTMSAVVCPWSGTFGYRSRLVEVMALGVPVVTSPDAVYGMEFKDGEGLLFGRDEKDLAAKASLLLTDSVFANEQSRLARKQVERLCTLDNTYGRLVRELFDWLRLRDK